MSSLGPRGLFALLVLLAGTACQSLQDIDRSDLNSPTMNLSEGIASSLSPLSGLRSNANSTGGCSVCAH